MPHRDTSGQLSPPTYQIAFVSRIFGRGSGILLLTCERRRIGSLMVLQPTIQFVEDNITEHGRG